MTSMPTTTSPDIAAVTIDRFIGALENGILDGIQMVWDIVISLLKEHLLLIAVVLLILLSIAFFKAMMGRWGMLGSVLYNVLYGSALLLIGFIWGPEVFVNDYFNLLCAVLLYPICYLAVGAILNKIRVR
jgi:hypothetical protein